MRTGISFTVSAEDRTRLEAVIFHPSSPQKHIWRYRFIAKHNATEAKPFIWRADPNEIIAARNRGFQMLDSIH